MYCRNCGSEVESINSVCSRCGFLPLNGKDYCQECGFTTKEGQVICTSCEQRLKFAPSPSSESYNSEQRSSNQSPNYQNYRYQTQDEDIPNTGANIAACCSLPFTGGLPIVGLVLYLVWKDEKPNAAKSVCMWSLIPFIPIMVFYIFFVILGGLTSLFSL